MNEDERGEDEKELDQATERFLRKVGIEPEVTGNAASISKTDENVLRKLFKAFPEIT